jgi:NAD(P)-dependent dehydrogenase (short-subunit alcohol dehydrogenase family)
VFNGMRAEIPPMLRAGAGVIVNVASIAAVTGLPFGSAYTASKHAVLGLTRSAALEYSSSGIRVVAVCPGVIDTPITSHLPKEIAELHLQKAIDAQAIKRSGEPAEVAALICFLASGEASFITGSAHLVDGGYAAA